MQSDSLPHYSVRISKKARYLQLRIRSIGLEVVVPARARLSQADITQFLYEKKHWIKKHVHMLAAMPHAERAHTLPQDIAITSFDETWQIDYKETATNRIRLKTMPPHTLLLEGAISNQANCVTLLKRWLKLKAHGFLESRLIQLAESRQLSFTEFSVRDMTSRWGSCSSQKKINLCVNLVFLPSHLIDHVILHELCHTKYMSHGKRFWGLLQRIDPHARKHAHELRQAMRFIPTWLLRT